MLPKVMAISISKHCYEVVFYSSISVCISIIRLICVTTVIVSSPLGKHPPSGGMQTCYCISLAARLDKQASAERAARVASQLHVYLCMWLIPFSFVIVTPVRQKSMLGRGGGRLSSEGARIVGIFLVPVHYLLVCQRELACFITKAEPEPAGPAC